MKIFNIAFVLGATLLCSSILWNCRPKSDWAMAYFEVDATPPLGSPVAYAKARSITDSLKAKGIVITGAGDPVVILAIDWITIANEGMQEFSQKLADAAGTTPDRVTIHVLHQHDTPRCDFSTEKLMADHGLGGTRHDNAYLNRVMDDAVLALSQALKKVKPVTQIGFGEAQVEKVASNRRILGDDGKVAIVRFSKSTDPKAQEVPEGLIDPWLKSVSFWSGNEPIVTLSYYATHPQSYYGEGDVTAEFIGMARKAREEATGVPQLFFIGAAGNVAAGKYNDGSVPMREVLAERIEKAMEQAWENTEKKKVEKPQWRHTWVQLPIAEHMKKDSLWTVLKDSVQATPDQRFSAARKIAWLDLQEKGRGINISSLQLGSTWLLHLPSEIFVEYQLYAQSLHPDGHVCTAGYGEGGQGYIGTEIAYTQGGYEVQPRVSMVAPSSEQVVKNAIETVLNP